MDISVIDREGYGPGVSSMTHQPQVTAMETSSGGGIVRGSIYHPNAAPNMSDAQVSLYNHATCVEYLLLVISSPNMFVNMKKMKEFQ